MKLTERTALAGAALVVTLCSWQMVADRTHTAHPLPATFPDGMKTSEITIERPKGHCEMTRDSNGVLQADKPWDECFAYLVLGTPTEHYDLRRYLDDDDYERHIGYRRRPHMLQTD